MIMIDSRKTAGARSELLGTRSFIQVHRYALC